jgi:methionyl-tRNA synthetase
VVVLTHKYYDGINPDMNLSNDIDKETLQEIYKFPKKIGDLIERYKFREAVNTVIDLARLGNKYLAEEEPWKLIKTDQKERVKTIMNISLQLCGVLSIVCEPFLPSTSKKLKKILNFENFSWNSISIDNPVKISNINKGELIFRKIEDDEIELQVQKLNESA